MISSTEDGADYTRGLLAESAERAFAELCTKEVIDAAEAGVWPAALWDNLEALGFTRAAISEEYEGSGVALADVLPMVRIAGRHAAPVPFGETIVAAWLLAGAGLAVPEGPLGFAPVDRRFSFKLTRAAQGWSLGGRLRNVPWGAQTRRIALVCETEAGLMVASIDPSLAEQTPGSNLAGEDGEVLLHRLQFVQGLAEGDALPRVANRQVTRGLKRAGHLLAAQ